MADVEHLQSLTAQFPLPYFPISKKTELMFPNILSSMMTVTIQVTALLQAMKPNEIHFQPYYRWIVSCLCYFACNKHIMTTVTCFFQIYTQLAVLPVTMFFILLFR